MNTEELVVDEGAEGECLEGCYRGLVELEAVLALALELEGEVLCQLAALVVPADEEEGVLVEDLQRVEVEEDLDREGPPVHVVPKEEVSGAVRWSPHLKKLD